MDILGIIPARGGSKGVPRKNIKLLAGKPLISYSIKAALQSQYINRLIVSTEDSEIKKISENYGSEVIERPKEFALDDSPTTDAVFHSLKILEKENYKPDLIVLLQATSPHRNEEDIDNAIKLFLESNCEAVVSVCNLDHRRIFLIKNNCLDPIMKESLHKRRQDAPDLYTSNGALYIIEPKILQKYGSFHPPETVPYIMPTDRSIDIDTEFNFQLSEFILAKIKKNEY